MPIIYIIRFTETGERFIGKSAMTLDRVITSWRSRLNCGTAPRKIQSLYKEFGWDGITFDHQDVPSGRLDGVYAALVARIKPELNVLGSRKREIERLAEQAGLTASGARYRLAAGIGPDRKRREAVRYNIRPDGQEPKLMTLGEIAAETGLPYRTLQYRVSRGWPHHMLILPSASSNIALRPGRRVRAYKDDLMDAEHNGGQDNPAT